jgi:hypothetical protein
VTSRASNRSRPTNRRRARRTAADIRELKDAIFSLLEKDNPQTVRQLFYRLVSVGAIPKTEQAYKNIVVRLTGQMRLEKEIPFSWLADNTRWTRKPPSYESLEQMLEESQGTYRRTLWKNQPDYVEIWLEKEALAGVLYEVTEVWDVPLMVTRGYPSLSFLHGAASQIEEVFKPVFLYYFGDLDPSGIDIARNVEQRIAEFAPIADVEFCRVAVTQEQVHEYGLLTRPTKASDSRAHGFNGESVEVDAIPAATLKSICQDRIERHIDVSAHLKLNAVQSAERDLLGSFLANLKPVPE